MDTNIYYDEESALYYQWDDESQGYVGLTWEQRVQRAIETGTVAYFDDNGIPVYACWYEDQVCFYYMPDTEQPNENVQCDPSINEQPLAEIVGSPEVTSETQAFSEKNNADPSPEGSLSSSEPTKSVEETVAKSVDPATSQARLREELTKEAKLEKISGGRSTTRRLTRKLTLIGGGQSLGDQLKAVAEAREAVGVEVLNDEEIRKRQAADRGREIARESIGGGGIPPSSLDREEASSRHSSSNEKIGEDEPEKISNPATIVNGEVPIARGKRNNTRFGTAHFKGGNLDALLNKKVK